MPTAEDRLRRLVLEGDAGDETISGLWSCTHSLRNHTGLDAHLFSDTAKFVWECAPEVLKSVMTDLGAIAGAALSVVVSVVGLVLTSVNLIVAGLRELWDELASLGGNSDSTYDIVILPAQQATSTAVYLPVTSGRSVAPPARPVPFVLDLAEGEHCPIRDGGAWSRPDDKRAGSALWLRREGGMG